MSVVVYEPRGAARELWLSKAPEILIEGPAGTGKSRGILQKVVGLADKYSRSRHLLCRKTRASMTESVLVTLEQKVIPTGHPMLNGPHRSHRTHYDLPNGSTLVVGGLDTPERTFSTEYDTVSVFEATETIEHEWESLHRALRNGQMGYHQAIADCNPGPPTHWLNQRAGTAKMQRLISRHEDNPLLWDRDRQQWTKEGAEYIARLDSLSGVRYLRLRKGIWAAAEGMVYEQWDRAVHLIDRFPIPKGWRRFRVFDFGYTNPFVCQWWALDPDSRLYLYREIYRTQRTVKVHAKRINELSAGESYEANIADHDAEDRATLREEGIVTVPARKAVSLGIQAVQERLKLAGDKKPRLFVMRDALVERDEALLNAVKPVCTEQEFEGYVWPKGQDGKALKEEPVKEDDHGMDGMRYIVAHVDRIGKRKGRTTMTSTRLRPAAA